MLKDAALLQLDLLLDALERDLILKDSTPCTTCKFRGGRALFVDVGSFQRAAAGRAVGRLPPVLHALPAPTAVVDAEGRALPAWLRGPLDVGITATEYVRPDVARATTSPRSASPTSSSTHGSSAFFRICGGEVRDVVGGWLLESPLPRGPCASSARSCSGCTGSRRGVWTVHRARNKQHVRGCCAQGGLRPRGGRGHARRSWSGTSAPTTDATRASPPSMLRTLVAIDADQGPIELLYRELRDEVDRQRQDPARRPRRAARGTAARSAPDRHRSRPPRRSMLGGEARVASVVGADVPDQLRRACRGRPLADEVLLARNVLVGVAVARAVRGPHARGRVPVQPLRRAPRQFAHVGDDQRLAKAGPAADRP